MTRSPKTALAQATEIDIASQPALWQRALDTPEGMLAPLPSAGASVLGIGCGSSYYILEAYARRRMQLGGGLTRAAIATEFDDPATYDAVILLSRSGITSDLLPVARELASKAYTVCITATPGSALTKITEAQVLLDFADDASVVQTRSATTALTVLRRSIGDRIGRLPQEAAAALEEPVAVDFTRYDHLVFLGTGWSYALAREAALKCQESASLRAEAYPAGEFRHGPIACANERTFVWSLNSVPGDLEAAVEQTGATMRIADGDPQVELVRVHKVAVAAARLRGIDADAPAHLARAIVNS